MSVESGAVKVGEFFLSAIISKIKTYIHYIKKCEDNLDELYIKLDELLAEKDTIDAEVVLRRQDNFKILTPVALLWFKSVRNLVNDESMKRLMNKDMRVAKVMLRLMKNDLKKLVEDDDKTMRDLVVKVMKDITKGKTKEGNCKDSHVVENDNQASTSQVSNVDENHEHQAGTSKVSNWDEEDKEVSKVLEKLMAETINEFKNLMQNDEQMAIAAMYLLETHKGEGKFKELTEMDEDVAEIIAKAKKMSSDEEIPSDNHDDENGTTDNVVANVDTLRNKVKDMLKPMRNFILNEEALNTLPDNLRLGVEAMDVVIGNRKELKAELMDSDNINSHRNCCGCVISYNYFSDRYHMSLAAEAMLATIEKLIGRKPDTENLIRRKPTGEVVAVAPDRVGLKSRNELLMKIITKLASKDVDALGVVGMGGSGKTTLAKEVANSQAKGRFETVVMVEISESPNIESIQNQIGDGLGLKLHSVHGIQEKAKQLQERLMPEDKPEEGKDEKKIPIEKNILVVLDNIWRKIDLDQIGIPRKHCKLLLTSRTKDVCKEMDVHQDNILEVGLLSKVEAEDLFKFQVKMVVTMEYKSVVDRLLIKCRGLPIAIVATATSLKGKELSFWRQFAEELEKPISCQISGVHHETFSILRTSYEVMASEDKKKFFLLACLSPVGTSISIDNLMRYGIGLDLFQHVNKLSEAIDLARSWAEELVSSSMLLKGDSDDYVKIHDVVRESTMSFASKSGINTDGNMFLVDAIPRWICEETFNKYTGISLLAEANFARLSGVKANLLQILLLKGNSDRSSVLEPNFFQGMTNLKVLEVFFMNFEKGLPESLCELKVLKTLHLVESELADIKLIGELGSLLVLSLRGSSLDGLPDEIGKLYNLRLLDLSECQCKEPRIPANVIARLSLLEGLYLVGSSFTEWAVKETTSSDTRVSTPADIEDLTKLDFLNVLEIQLGELVLPICDQFVKNLDKFQISVGQKDFGLQPSPRALILASKFDVSQELKKDNCLKALLKKADVLALKSATVKNIVPELDKEGFRDLSYLELCEIDSISRICEGKAPTELFYNLSHLEVSDLEKLEVLLPVNPLPGKMTTLEISDCDKLTYIFSEDDGVNKDSDIIELPCLKKLKLKRISNLISVVKESNNDDSRGRPSFFNCKVTLTALEELSLKYNGSIVKLWDKESNMQSFQNLKVLKISNCKEMETIGPPSMFLSLVQLESLKIEDCEKMQQVISDGSETQEIPKEVITFPKLKRLNIKNMENLECFYGGSYKMAFPRLENLDLSFLERMTKFAGGINSTAFFPNTVQLTSLEELLLYYNESIVQLWDKEPNLHSFKKLKVLRIKSCEKMEPIGPPSMFLSLVQLESLTIEGCEKMQQVISDGSETQEIPKEVITFPKLKHLSIYHMMNLECFYGGSCKMAFPHLENLDLRYLERMTKFAGGINSTAFFPNTIEFPCLEEIYLHKVSDEVTVLWELHEGEAQGISSNPLPNLRTLTVEKIKLQSIVFPSLSYLYIREPVIGDAKFLFSSSSSENEGCVGTYSQFPKLEQLKIECCSNSAQQFVKDDGSTAMLNFCGQLRILELYSTSNLEMTCSHSFKSLRQLSISGLTSEYLFSVDCGFEQLQSLEELSIQDCPNMKVIIQGDDKDKAVVFPRLKRFDLENLESMSKLCSISDIPLRFPSLEYLYIYSCNKLESLFCGEPNQVVELPALENIYILDCNAMKSFSTRPLKAPNLRDLSVSNCPNMEWFFLGDLNCNADLELSSLEEVTIKRCPNMKSFSPALLRAPRLRELSVAECNKWEWLFDGEPNQVVELPSLEQVTIDECVAIKSFSTRPLKAPKLRQLAVFNCPAMECFLSGNSNCSAALLELPSLERLTIARCPNMKSFSPALITAPRLRDLYVAGCNKWEWLFDGEPNQVVELPSLEQVTIEECDAMKSLSSRPLKAPNLRELTVSNCPEMEWFLLGNSNCNADLELPSLENVIIEACPNMRSFSPAVLRAPKLELVEVDDEPYLVAEIEDINHFLQTANSSEQTAADIID